MACRNLSSKNGTYWNFVVEFLNMRGSNFQLCVPVSGFYLILSLKMELFMYFHDAEGYVLA